MNYVYSSSNWYLWGFLMIYCYYFPHFQVPSPRGDDHGWVLCLVWIYGSKSPFVEFYIFWGANFRRIVRCKIICYVLFEFYLFCGFESLFELGESVYDNLSTAILRFENLFSFWLEVGFLGRSDVDDSVSKMQAAEEALQAKQKVMCCLATSSLIVFFVKTLCCLCSFLIQCHI